MAISEAHAGRTYPPTPPYLVSEAKIAEFAAAIGDQHPRYAGPEAIAPPMFVAVVSGRAWEQMFEDPELGLALRRIVHGDQRFTYHRPVRVGDNLSATLTIDKVRSRSTADIISASLSISADPGGPVCTAAATFFHSHPAPEAGDSSGGGER